MISIKTEMLKASLDKDMEMEKKPKSKILQWSRMLLYVSIVNGEVYNSALGK